MPPVPTNANQPRRTRAERREHFRGQLLQTVERLLKEETFPELTVDRIIAEAQVSRSTFYFHFPDKATLLLELAGDVMDDAIVVAEPWWNLGPDATRDDLERAIGAIVDLYLPHRDVIRALAAAAAYEPAVAGKFAQRQHESIEKLAEHILAGQRAGFVRSGLRPDETAGWLVWMLERGLYQMVASATTAETARLLGSVTDVIWFTLYDGPREERRRRHDD
jgi:AcrR family transcriptional regulator